MFILLIFYVQYRVPFGVPQHDLLFCFLLCGMGDPDCWGLGHVWPHDGVMFVLFWLCIISEVGQYCHMWQVP
jgi:hypothetical protein